MKKTILASCILGLVGASTMHANDVNDIWSELRDIQNRFEEIFGHNKKISTQEPSQQASINIREGKDVLVVEANLAGFTPDEVKLEISDNILYISAEKKNQKEVKNEGGYVKEEISKSIKTRRKLPCPIEESKGKAKLNNGILRIELPKKTEKKSSQPIQITTD